MLYEVLLSHTLDEFHGFYQIIHSKLALMFEGMTVTIYPKKYSINMDATC